MTQHFALLTILPALRSSHLQQVIAQGVLESYALPTAFNHLQELLCHWVSWDSWTRPSIVNSMDDLIVGILNEILRKSFQQCCQLTILVFQ